MRLAFYMHKVTGLSHRNGGYRKERVLPYCLLTTMKLGTRQVRIRLAVAKPNATTVALDTERGPSANTCSESTVFKVQGATFRFCGNIKCKSGTNGFTGSDMPFAIHLDYANAMTPKKFHLHD